MYICRMAPFMKQKDPSVPPGQTVTTGFTVLHIGEVPSYDLQLWRLKISGLVEHPFEIGYDDLRALPATEWNGDIHCVPRWSKKDTHWRGVKFKTLVERAQPMPSATFVVQHADNAYTPNLPLAPMLDDDVLIAYEFDGKPLQSVAKGEVDLDSEEEKTAHEAEREEQGKDFAELLTWLQETLSDHVKEVRLSTRLTESPACLITDAFGITPALARLYRSSGQDVPLAKRILELNPKHPLVTGLRQAHQDRGDDPSVAETAELLYGTALLAEGGALEDPARFAELLADRLTRTV